MPRKKIKLTPEIQEHIVLSLKGGAFFEHAANAAGISFATFKSWMIRGSRNKDAVHSNFYRAVKQARGHILCKMLIVIDRAINKGDWRASAWMVKQLSQDKHEETPKYKKHAKKSRSDEELDEEDEELEEKSEEELE